MAEAPQRIVSLVPSHTESLFDLGLGSRVVGRTRFCIHPTDVEKIPIVGGTKDASLERIEALRPQLVVADKDENPKALVTALEEGGTEVLWSDIGTPGEAAAFLQRLGERCGVPTETHVQAIEAAIEEVRGAGEGRTVFCPIWHKPWMTFDATAYPCAMLAAVGLKNAFATHVGPKYFEVAERDVARSTAQWTLLPTEPFPFHRYPVETARLGPAGRKPFVRIIDGEALTWFGTRTASGLRALAATAREITQPIGDAAKEG